MKPSSLVGVALLLATAAGSVEPRPLEAGETARNVTNLLNVPEDFETKNLALIARGLASAVQVVPFLCDLLSCGDLIGGGKDKELEEMKQCQETIRQMDSTACGSWQPPQATEQPLGQVVYVPCIGDTCSWSVQYTDTFTSIASELGIPTSTIQDWNPGVATTSISVNQFLSVPCPTAMPCIHVAEQAETLASIAADYYTTEAQLMALNPEAPASLAAACPLTCQLELAKLGNRCMSELLSRMSGYQQQQMMGMLVECGVYNPNSATRPAAAVHALWSVTLATLSYFLLL